MLLAPLRWLGRNLGTLLLAFVLAIVVWVSATVTADPNVERTYRAVTIEVTGLASNMTVVGEIPGQARLTLDAPQSIWDELNNNPGLVNVWIDLSGLGPGTHDVPVQRKIDISPVRVTQMDPETVSVTLEQIISRDQSVDLIVSGDPAQGYRKGTPTIDPQTVTISGPESVISKVTDVRAALDISGANETIDTIIPAQAVDSNGDPVENVTVTPRLIDVTQPINLIGGYKSVVVKPVTEGQPANGYRLTNISVTPPTVLIFSANPRYVNAVPGYVETKPVDLTGLQDDTEVRLELNLPPEVSLVEQQSVLVQIGIAAIEGSMTINVPVEATGLPPELHALISPAIVDLIVSGPLPVLDTLNSQSFRAVVDLSGLEQGTYQLEPTVDLVPDQVEVQSMLPQTVEVTIETAPTATPTQPLTSSNSLNAASGTSKASATPQP